MCRIPDGLIRRTPGCTPRSSGSIGRPGARCTIASGRHNPSASRAAPQAQPQLCSSSGRHRTPSTASAVSNPHSRSASTMHSVPAGFGCVPSRHSRSDSQSHDASSSRVPGPQRPEVSTGSHRSPSALSCVPDPHCRVPADEPSSQPPGSSKSANAAHRIVDALIVLPKIVPGMSRDPSPAHRVANFLRGLAGRPRDGIRFAAAAPAARIRELSEVRGFDSKSDRPNQPVESCRSAL